MLAPVAIVLVAQGDVERLGREMVEHEIVPIDRDPAVAVGPQLVDEGYVPPAFRAAYKGKKLTPEEVSALERSYTQKARFRGVVSEGLKRGDAFWCSHESPQNEKTSIM